MANFVYNTAALELLDGTINLNTDNVEWMLVTSSYVADRDDDVVDAGGANDPLDHEIVATGYTGGHAGAGRKDANGGAPAWTVDKTNDRAEWDADDPPTWSPLGNGANATIAAAILIKRGPTNDTDARLILYVDTTTGTPSLPFLTNGSDFTLNYNAEGLIHGSTV